MIARFRALPAFLPFLLILSLASGCRRPSSFEQFIRAEDAAGGVYEFAVSFDASTCDLSFYTAPLAEPLQLEVTWLNYRDTCSTVDILMSETVWFPAGQHCALYRSGMTVPSGAGMDASALPGAGTILLQVKPVNPPRNFRGLGIIFRKDDGTR
jgi:hypothetical protein